MLIAIMTFLFLGGSSSSGLTDFVKAARADVKEVVEDKDRRRAATATMKQLKKAASARTKAFGRISKRVGKLGDGGDFNAQQVDDIWYQFFAVNDQYSREMIELRFQLREQLTREEWEQVFPTPE